MQRTFELINGNAENANHFIDIDIAGIVREVSVKKRFDIRVESCDISPTSWPDVMSTCTDDSTSLSELSGTADGDDNAETFTTSGSNCSVFDLRQAIVKRLSEMTSESKKVDNESPTCGVLRAMVHSYYLGYF